MSTTKRAIEPLTGDEVRALIGAASAESASGVRLRALIAVLYGSGLRISEALDLKPHDIDTHAGIVRVHNGKGGKARTVGIDHNALALLAPWMERRKALGLNGRHYIFGLYTKGKVGKRMDDEYVRQALTRLRDKAGIAKRVHPHGMRHSRAYAMAMGGVPTTAIQAALGHESLAVTDRYVRHIAPAEVIGIMRAQEW